MQRQKMSWTSLDSQAFYRTWDLTQGYSQQSAMSSKDPFSTQKDPLASSQQQQQYQQGWGQQQQQYQQGWGQQQQQQHQQQGLGQNRQR